MAGLFLLGMVPLLPGRLAGAEGDKWLPITTDGAPGPYYAYTAVWTGEEMLVWSGRDGGRYNPRTDRWTPISTDGGPGPRTLHTAVWTGSEMIVWGGLGPCPTNSTNCQAGPSLNDGARYDPQTDT